MQGETGQAIGVIPVLLFFVTLLAQGMLFLLWPHFIRRHGLRLMSRPRGLGKTGLMIVQRISPESHIFWLRMVGILSLIAAAFFLVLLVRLVS